MARAASYGRLLRAPGVRSVLLASIVARLPMGIDVLALLLFMHDRTGSFAGGGAAVGALALGRATGAVLQGRLLDRHGLVRVLLPAAYGHGLLLGAVVGLGLAGAPVAAVAVCALLAGLTDPPISSVVRPLWLVLLRDRTALLPAAFGLDTVLVELVFVAGPLLTAVAVAAGGAHWALAASALLVAGGASALAAVAPAASRPPPGRHALRAPGVRAAALTMLPIGVCFGGLEVAMPAFGQSIGGDTASALLLALFSIGSIAGGLVYGARPVASVRRTFLRLLCVLPAGVLPLTIAPSEPVVIGALAVVGGACIAPLLAALAQLVGEYASAGTVTEAYTWIFTAMIGGTSIGYGAVGALVEARGWRAGFAAALLAALVATFVGLHRRGRWDLAMRESRRRGRRPWRLGRWFAGTRRHDAVRGAPAFVRSGLHGNPLTRAEEF